MTLISDEWHDCYGDHQLLSGWTHGLLHWRIHMAVIGNLAKDQWFVCSQHPVMDLVQLFCQLDVVSNCLLHSFIYPHKSAQFLDPSREIYLFSGWWLMQNNWINVENKCLWSTQPQQDISATLPTKVPGIYATLLTKVHEPLCRGNRNILTIRGWKTLKQSSVFWVHQDCWRPVSQQVWCLQKTCKKH